MSNTIRSTPYKLGLFSTVIRSEKYTFYRRVIESLPWFGKTVVYLIPYTTVRGSYFVEIEQEDRSFIGVALKAILCFSSALSWLLTARSASLGQYRYFIWGLRIPSFLLICAAINKGFLRKKFSYYIYDDGISKEDKQILDAKFGKKRFISCLPPVITIDVGVDSRPLGERRNFSFPIVKCKVIDSGKTGRYIMISLFSPTDKISKTWVCDVKGEHIDGPEFEDVSIQKLIEDGTAKDTAGMVWQVVGKDGIIFNLTEAQKRVWDDASGQLNFIDGVPYRAGIDHPQIGNISHRIMKGVAKTYYHEPRNSTIFIQIQRADCAEVKEVLHFYPHHDSWKWCLGDNTLALNYEVSFLPALLNGEEIELEGNLWKIIPEQSED